MNTYANTHDDPVIIYTDGACQNNPGRGGWGAVLTWGEKKKKELCGGHEDTTNNRMELTAAIVALVSLKDFYCVEVFTDSTYVQQGISKWIKDWKAKGWKTSSGKAPKNADLWERLDEVNQIHDVKWCWVKGHAGNEGNEKADRLAAKGMNQL